MRQGALCAFILILVVGILWTFESPDIKTILNNPYRFRQNVVMVKGTVMQSDDESARNSQYYYLKDDGGGIIKFIANSTIPDINGRYEIKGSVLITDKGEVVLIPHEIKKLALPEDDPGTGFYLLIGGAGALLLSIIVLTIVLTKREKNYPIPIPGPTTYNPRQQRPHPRANMIEGQTIKMTSPPAGTLKLLPGRLEVVAGDDIIKNIRFYKAKNREETEITFGRGPGPDYTHIQLNSDSVSAKQAKIMYMNGTYTLINYSTVNPTVVSNISLGKENSVNLEEGTRIEMGNVTFIFHAK
ncbi:MAG: FHA domain-containing protein [Candidatus Omnitrophota bacterium]